MSPLSFFMSGHLITITEMKSGQKMYRGVGSSCGKSNGVDFKLLAICMGVEDEGMWKNCNFGLEKPMNVVYTA